MFTLLRYFFLLRPAAMLIWRLMLDRRVPLAAKIIPILALAYIISPIDLVPDFLPIRGQLDDIFVTVILLGMFLMLAPWSVIMEHATGRSSGDSGDAKKFKGKTIDGEYRLEDDEAQ
ncbi:MAG: DUF1232 domain-containing protein [Chloroflexi bacterium]|nr:DUF1232 domain-containing protein [Chloroflexota bacterium]